MAIFNSTLFNKAIFNTKFIPANTGGVAKWRKQPKQYLTAYSGFKVSSNIIIPTGIKIESKILTDIHSTVVSNISINHNIYISSKILTESSKKVVSSISKDMTVHVKAKLINMELKLNRMLKNNAVMNNLLLLDI